MKKLTLLVMLLAVGTYAAPPQPDEIHAASAGDTIRAVSAYQAVQKTFRVFYAPNTTTNDNITGCTPIMRLYPSVTSTVFYTSSWSVVSYATGIVDFTFSAQNLNFSNGLAGIYGVGLLVNGHEEMYGQGNFTVKASAFGVGVPAPVAVSNVNMDLYGWSGGPFLRRDGSVSATGNLDMGGHTISNATINVTLSETDPIAMAALADYQTKATADTTNAAAWAAINGKQPSGNYATNKNIEAVTPAMIAAWNAAGTAVDTNVLISRIAGTEGYTNRAALALASNIYDSFVSAMLATNNAQSALIQLLQAYTNRSAQALASNIYDSFVTAQLSTNNWQTSLIQSETSRAVSNEATMVSKTGPWNPTTNIYFGNPYSELVWSNHVAGGYTNGLFRQKVTSVYNTPISDLVWLYNIDYWHPDGANETWGQPDVTNRSTMRFGMSPDINGFNVLYWGTSESPGMTPTRGAFELDVNATNHSLDWGYIAVPLSIGDSAGGDSSYQLTVHTNLFVGGTGAFGNVSVRRSVVITNSDVNTPTSLELDGNLTLGKNRYGSKYFIFDGGDDLANDRLMWMKTQGSNRWFIGSGGSVGGSEDHVFSRFLGGSWTSIFGVSYTDTVSAVWLASGMGIRFGNTNLIPSKLGYWDSKIDNGGTATNLSNVGLFSAQSVSANSLTLYSSNGLGSELVSGTSPNGAAYINSGLVVVNDGLSGGFTLSNSLSASPYAAYHLVAVVGQASTGTAVYSFGGSTNSLAWTAPGTFGFDLWPVQTDSLSVALVSTKGQFTLSTSMKKALGTNNLRVAGSGQFQGNVLAPNITAIQATNAAEQAARIAGDTLKFDKTGGVISGVVTVRTNVLINSDGSAGFGFTNTVDGIFWGMQLDPTAEYLTFISGNDGAIFNGTVTAGDQGFIGNASGLINILPLCLNATNTGTAGQSLMLGGSSNAFYWATPSAGGGSVTQLMSKNIAVMVPTNMQRFAFSEASNAWVAVDPGMVSETDPYWTASSGGVWSAINGKQASGSYATGLPLYVETDPRATGIGQTATNALNTGTVAYAVASNTWNNIIAASNVAAAALSGSVNASNLAVSANTTGTIAYAWALAGSNEAHSVATKYWTNLVFVSSPSNYHAIIGQQMFYCDTNGGGAGGGGTDVDTLQTVMNRGNSTTNGLWINVASNDVSGSQSMTGILIRTSSGAPSYQTFVDIGYDNGFDTDNQSFNAGPIMVGSKLKAGYGAIAMGYGSHAYYTGIAIGGDGYTSGNGAVAGVNSLAIGQLAYASGGGISIGSSSHTRNNGSVAIGTGSEAMDYGASVGQYADSSFMGASLGGSAKSANGGVAVGFAANGQGTVDSYPWDMSGGMAIGAYSLGNMMGIAIGSYAVGAHTNMAIGLQANASTNGSNRIAIGTRITNEVDNSIAVRGSLYLDGGTGTFTRATFGSGAWYGTYSDGTNLWFVNSTGGVQKITNL